MYYFKLEVDPIMTFSQGEEYIKEFTKIPIVTRTTFQHQPDWFVHDENKTYQDEKHLFNLAVTYGGYGF
ncbi:MAG: hypothetical protein ACHP9Y_01295 [Gammaproteobacteria bacterium]